VRVGLVTAGNADLVRTLRLLPRVAVDVIAPGALHDAGRFDALVLDRFVPNAPPAAPALLIGPRSAENRVPVFTFVLEGRAPLDVARALDEQGIAVRAGDMAAMPLLKRFGASEAIRASAYVYSTLRDIDRLADALHGIRK
jgi:cysteine desulfurase/selenocysteine lyase